MTKDEFGEIRLNSAPRFLRIVSMLTSAERHFDKRSANGYFVCFLGFASLMWTTFFPIRAKTSEATPPLPLRPEQRIKPTPVRPEPVEGSLSKEACRRKPVEARLQGCKPHSSAHLHGAA